MFDSLRYRLGVFVARLRFRKRRDKVVSFTRAFSGADRILLILPFTADAAKPWSAVLDLLRRTVDKRSLTIITIPGEQDTMRMFPGSRIIRLSPEDINALRLPRHAALRRTLEGPYDLAIDLNIDFLLPSGYICRESGARVRVGFFRKRADAFYNLTLHPDPAQGKPLMYERLVQCLQMF